MGVPWAELATVGPWGLVTIFVLMVFFGFLVPGKDRNYWREAFFKEQEMRRNMEVTGRLQKKVFDSLPNTEDGLE